MAIRLINEDVAGDPHSGWATRGHEAERTAERIAFEFESEEDEIEKYKEDQRRVLDSGGGLADMASWAGQSAIKGSSESMRMALLTFSIIGIQFTWGIEMTYCTPYLLQLGLTKSRTSLVWIAGPLSGLIMQPIVGVIADRSRSKYGRRRPFMVIGSVIVAACLMILGWTKEVVGHFVQEGEFRKTCTIAVAVLSIYAVDFAINAVQASCRSLIVDTLPISKQQVGSAWASRMASMGHLIGYAVGTMDLVQIFGPSLGDTQFKKLILVAAFALLFAVGVTSWAVTERVLISSRETESQAGPTQILRQIFHATMTLPPRIQAICWAQFWSWIGWFPFLFYSTTWVGETYFRYDAPHDVKQSKDVLGDIGRIGSMSLVVFSFVTFVGALIFPLLIKSPTEESFTPRPPAAIAGIATKFQKYKPDLLSAWICGHLMFSCAMVFAPFAHSFRFATNIVGFCGLPWAIACWAPNAFMGIEVNRLSSGDNYEGLARSNSFELASPITPHTPSSPSLLRLENGPSDDNVGSAGELAGLYFGILNIYTTLPQFVGTFLSMLVFSILEPGKSPELAHDAHPSEHHSTDGPNAIAVCLFIGAISTLVAAYATKKLRDLQ